MSSEKTVFFYGSIQDEGNRLTSPTCRTRLTRLTRQSLQPTTYSAEMLPKYMQPALRDYLASFVIRSNEERGQ
jgi:hypothetical protein